MKKIFFESLFLLFIAATAPAGSLPAAVPADTTVRILVLTERGGQHGGFTDAGLLWLGELCRLGGFALTEINDTAPIDRRYLSRFRLVVQLDYPPYTWTEPARDALIDYIENGRSGWIGFHHATLLGEFDGYPLWQWFSDFMGGIRFRNYIAALASATVIVEEPHHPVMAGVAPSFTLPDEEWYTFDRSPRPNVRVLAKVDESTYDPPSDVTMGDHPAVWTNPAVGARNVYFLMGHAGSLFDSEEFVKMFSNTVRWACGIDE